MPSDTEQMREIIAEGARLAVFEQGPAEAADEPVVLLHGYVGSHRTWRHQMPALAKRYRVVAPDWAGWGKSGRDPELDYRFDTEIARLLSLLDQLGIVRCNLFGHDYGGLLALGLALRHPDRVSRLALLNTRAHDSFHVEWMMIFGIMNRLGQLPGAAQLARTLPLSFAHRNSLMREIRMGVMSRELVAEYTDWMSKDPQGAAFLAKFMGDYRISAREDFAAELGNIKCPTAVIWGAKDVYLPVRIAHELQQGIPGARLTLFEKSGHFICEEQPKAVLEALEALLARSAA